MTPSDNSSEEQFDIRVGPRVEMQFLFLGGNAMAWYVMARRSLTLGYGDAAVVAAHQSIELLIKVVVQQHDRKESGQHRLVSSMSKHRQHVPYFDEVLRDPRKQRFLEQLTEVYYHLRYGEAGSEMRLDTIRELLDEIAGGLWRLYLQTLRTPAARFYVHKDDQAVLLRDNRHFSAADITTSRLAIWGPIEIGPGSALDSLPSTD